MELSDLKISWTDAAKDLGVSIDTSFLFNGSEIILIKSYGSKLGTLIVPIESRIKIDFEDLKNKGFYVSQLGDGYKKYNKDLFIDTLNDWGYFGSESLKPIWYNGKPWSE